MSKTGLSMPTTRRCDPKVQLPHGRSELRNDFGLDMGGQPWSHASIKPQG